MAAACRHLRTLRTCQNKTIPLYFAYVPLFCRPHNQTFRCDLRQQYHGRGRVRCPVGVVTRPWSVAGRTTAGLPCHLGRWGQQATRSKRSNYGNQDSSDDDDSDEDDSDDQFGPHFEEDRDFPNNYRELKVYVTSLRADAILGGGLNISRKKIDDYFLASKLLINGARVIKKSKQMEPGDNIDLITDVAETTMTVKRVRLVKVDSKKSSKDRHLAYLRAWRANTSVPRTESRKWSPP